MCIDVQESFLLNDHEYTYYWGVIIVQFSFEFIIRYTYSVRITFAKGLVH